MSNYYTIFVLSKISEQWERIAEIKSPGLTNLLLPTIKKFYGEIKVIKGRHTTLPKKAT